MGWATCPPYPQKTSGALAEAGAPDVLYFESTYKKCLREE